MADPAHIRCNIDCALRGLKKTSCVIGDQRIDNILALPSSKSVIHAEAEIADILLERVIGNETIAVKYRDCLFAEIHVVALHIG